jgi:hypothetical protein
MTLTPVTAIRECCGTGLWLNSGSSLLRGNTRLMIVARSPNLSPIFRPALAE